eukprot:1119199-Prymnesium_polylepis.1
MENVMKPAKQLELFSIRMDRHAVCASYTIPIRMHYNLAFSLMPCRKRNSSVADSLTSSGHLSG